MIDTVHRGTFTGVLVEEYAVGNINQYYSSTILQKMRSNIILFTLLL